MNLKLHGEYRYITVVDSVKKLIEAPDIEEIGVFEIGRNFLIFENKESQSGKILTFVLTGTMGNEGVYKLIYSDYHE